jgi:hypothetical protein
MVGNHLAFLFVYRVIEWKDDLKILTLLFFRIRTGWLLLSLASMLCNDP